MHISGFEFQVDSTFEYLFYFLLVVGIIPNLDKLTKAGWPLWSSYVSDVLKDEIETKAKILFQQFKGPEFVMALLKEIPLIGKLSNAGVVPNWVWTVMGSTTGAVLKKVVNTLPIGEQEKIILASVAQALPVAASRGIVDRQSWNDKVEEIVSSTADTFEKPDILVKTGSTATVLVDASGHIPYVHIPAYTNGKVAFRNGVPVAQCGFFNEQVQKYLERSTEPNRQISNRNINRQITSGRGPDKSIFIVTTLKQGVKMTPISYCPHCHASTQLEEKGAAKSNNWWGKLDPNAKLVIISFIKTIVSKQSSMWVRQRGIDYLKELINVDPRMVSDVAMQCQIKADGTLSEDHIELIIGMILSFGQGDLEFINKLIFSALTITKWLGGREKNWGYAVAAVGAMLATLAVPVAAVFLWLVLFVANWKYFIPAAFVDETSSAGYNVLWATGYFLLLTLAVVPISWIFKLMIDWLLKERPIDHLVKTLLGLGGSVVLYGAFMAALTMVAAPIEVRQGMILVLLIRFAFIFMSKGHGFNLMERKASEKIASLSRWLSTAVAVAMFTIFGVTFVLYSMSTPVKAYQVSITNHDQGNKKKKIWVIPTRYGTFFDAESILPRMLYDRIPGDGQELRYPSGTVVDIPGSMELSWRERDENGDFYETYRSVTWPSWIRHYEPLPKGEFYEYGSELWDFTEMSPKDRRNIMGTTETDQTDFSTPRWLISYHGTFPSIYAVLLLLVVGIFFIILAYQLPKQYNEAGWSAPSIPRRIFSFLGLVLVLLAFSSACVWGVQAVQYQTSVTAKAVGKIVASDY